jgi:PAS domain S-box-containing protein
MGVPLTTPECRQELALQVLELLNRPGERVDAIRELLHLFKDKTGFDAVGIRIKEGEDYPYYEVSGFDRAFVEAENSICSHTDDGSLVRDEKGLPRLECLCGAVIRSNLPETSSFTTGGGSFWTNRSSRFTSESSPEEQPDRPRYRCVFDGYESMGLVPLMARSERVGLLQFNDRRPDLFVPEMLTFLESLGHSIGVSLIRRRTEERLQEMFQLVKRSHDDHLTTLNMLRLGVLTLDREGRLQFVNRAAQRFMGCSQEDVSNCYWTELPFLNEQVRDRIGEMLNRPEQERERFLAEIELTSGNRFWMDMEIRNDPAEPDRRILFLYDMTEVYDLRQVLDGQGKYHQLVGRSALMQSLYRRIQEVASVDFTVLVEGDTGTGKELVARAIHQAGPRAKGPFVAVNCAGLSESLLTSQLFGHRRGAYTGAVEDRKGYFEAAEGGTLFLDEIGDISSGLQATLLRVLEDKQVTRVGETRARSVDVRIVAATNHDLAADAAAGRFRSDLLYRLRVARLKVPTLAERKEDIPLLVESFLHKACAVMGRNICQVSQDAMAALMRHDWPGNVRELKAAVEFATIHCGAELIHPADFPEELQEAEKTEFPISSLTAAVPEDDERDRIRAALAQARGNRTRAAQLLGISRATFYRRLAELE